VLCHATIEPPALDLLKKLLSFPEFEPMRLAGGTALALQIGHRRSHDLDLFGTLEADAISIETRLRQCGELAILGRSANVLLCTVGGVSVDIVNYPYPWLTPAVDDEGVRLADRRDIAAMKLAAIANRGSRKDFVDFFFLLRQFPLSRMVEFYLTKYADGAAFPVLKSLTYFDDAEDEPMPVTLAPLAWADVRREVLAAVEGYLK